MFEVIGIIVVVYLLVGAVVLTSMFALDTMRMRRELMNTAQRGAWLELAFIVVFSLWCWPWPVIEALSD